MFGARGDSDCVSGLVFAASETHRSGKVQRKTVTSAGPVASFCSVLTGLVC